MAETKQKGLKGFSKMGSDFESKPNPAKKEHEGGGGNMSEGESQTVVTHHADGSHSVDGQHHPDHLHAGAHLLHKMSGGDKHHIVHHDGMSASSHTIHEDGTHEPHGEHNSAEEAKGALDKFLGEEAQEPMHQGEPQPEHESAYGGM